MPLSNEAKLVNSWEVSSSGIGNPFSSFAIPLGADLGTRQSIAEIWYFKQRKSCVVLRREM
jgi:hypothetical protein